METRSLTLLPLVALMASISSAANAGPLDVRANDAIHIVFPTDLRADVNRPGDGFYADIDHDPLLPQGARLYGHILSVRMGTPRQAASMRMQFDTLELPSGEKLSVEAIPVALNDPHLTRGTNGRLVAQYKPGDQAAYTVGGAAGGLIIGGLVHRPFAGTFIGAIIGSIAGHEDRREKQNLIVSKGDHMAALFEADITGEASAPPPPPPAQDGWRAREGRHRMAPPYYEGRYIEIRDNDRAVNFDPAFAPYRAHGTIMVPIDLAAERFQVDVSHRHDGLITIEGPDGSVDLRKGSDEYRTDGDHSGVLRNPVEEHHGTLYAPIEVFAMVRADRIVVNGYLVPRGE